MRKTYEATVENVLRLMEKRLREFSGESRRSYSKALSSLRIYLISNYKSEDILTQAAVMNWVTDNLLHNLSSATVSFYLDKVASLYTAILPKLKERKNLDFKEMKSRLKALPSQGKSAGRIVEVVEKIRSSREKNRNPRLLQHLLQSLKKDEEEKEGRKEKYLFATGLKQSLNYIRGALALNAGILPGMVKSFLGEEVPQGLEMLRICEAETLTKLDENHLSKIIIDNIYGEEVQWYAMRLRPGVSYEDLLLRFRLLQKEVKMPELFYPLEEIARRIGRKVMVKGKPVIRDVVFFRKRQSEIYPMFTKLYDLAWCYRRGGMKSGNYASIPAGAMQEFKNAIGLLTPDFDVTPTGQVPLKPGDEVVIIDPQYLNLHGRILKVPKVKEEGSLIYRVRLTEGLGRWEIALDARLIKKCE